MKYMLLIYLTETEVDDAEREQCYKDSTAALPRTEVEGSVHRRQPVAIDQHGDQRAHSRR